MNTFTKHASRPALATLGVVSAAQMYFELKGYVSRLHVMDTLKRRNGTNHNVAM